MYNLTIDNVHFQLWIRDVFMIRSEQRMMEKAHHIYSQLLSGQAVIFESFKLKPNKKCTKFYIFKRKGSL